MSRVKLIALCSTLMVHPFSAAAASDTNAMPHCLKINRTENPSQTELLLCIREMALKIDALEFGQQQFILKFQMHDKLLQNDFDDICLLMKIQSSLLDKKQNKSWERGKCGLPLPKN